MYPVLVRNDGVTQVSGGYCLSNGDLNRLNQLGGCDASNIVGSNGLDDCHKHIVLSAGESRTFSSNDLANNCQILIYAPGSFIYVEGTKFKVRKIVI